MPSIFKLELTEGVEASLPDGTAIHLTSVMYAHLSDSQNLSRSTLVLTRGSQTAEVQLENHHGGTGPVPGSALGWRFSLVMADPYQRPAQAIVEATQP